VTYVHPFLLWKDGPPRSFSLQVLRAHLMKRHFVQCMDLPMSFCVSSVARFVPFLFWGRFARHHPKKGVFYWKIKALTSTPNKTRFASVDVWDYRVSVSRQSIHFLKDTLWSFTIHCEPVRVCWLTAGQVSLALRAKSEKKIHCEPVFWKGPM